MGALTSPLCCAVKCCGCIIMSQLIGLLMSIGMLVLFIAAFYFFLLPWGERKIVSELGLPAGTDYDSISASAIAAQNCSGCVFGRNTDWPTTTDGTLHFLDTSAGTTISSVVATSLVATAAAGAGTMLWASMVPSMASAMSFAGGFYEMTHILEQAQYIGMIGQLQLKGAPEFLNQFSKELAWTNFNLPTSLSDKFLPSRRLALTDTVSDTASAAVQPKYDGETGPAKYAKTLGVDAKDLFFYTLKVFAAVVVVIHVLYIIWILIMSCVNKKLTFGQIASKWYRKVIWAVLLALLLAQYIFAMTGSYFIYENMRSDEPKDSHFALACVLLVAVVGFAIIFGIAVIANNTDELKDIGTVEHDDRPFAAKYSAYYDEYNFDNRFFFVPRILLAVGTGVVVGVVQDPTKQLFFVLGLTFLYLLLIIVREPNLLRFLYYIGLTSVFMKVVLVCMMLVLVQDDFFPQNVRDKVAYAIIGVNIFIFFLLFLRQAYIIVYKIVRGCKNKGKSNDDDDDGDARRNAIEEANRGGRYERLNSIGGAHGTRNGGPADPYSQSQQFKEQNFMAQQQQQQPYGRGEGGIQGASAGAAVGYGANGRYGQQQQHQQQSPSPADMYGQQAGGRGAGRNQDGYGNDQQQGGGNQYRYGSGSEPAYGAQGGRGSAQNGYGVENAKNGRPQGRSIADRYLGLEAGGAAAVVGAGVAVGATANARSSQQDNQRMTGPEGGSKPEPEKYTWRRNMERRAAESAMAEEAAHPQPPQRDSLLRFDSDDSYGTESRAAGSSRGMDSYNFDTVAQNNASPRQRQQQQSYGTESTDDWFDRRAPSDVGSYTSATTLGRSDVFGGSSLAPGSSTGGDDVNSSFMSADSYSSGLQGSMVDSQRSFNSALDASSQSGMQRSNTQNLDNLAVAYLEQTGGGAGATENDIGDEDDDEDEGVAPLLDFPKVGDVDDDKDETESVDIDASANSDDDDDDDDENKSGDKDIDVDDEEDEDIDRESVDIDDESDEDVDIDAISSHDKDTMANTFLSDISADRDSYSNIKQLDDIRDSYMSDGSQGYARQMSDVSLRSDDDASFYLEGRRVDSPSAEEREKEREKAAGPLKL